MLLVFVGCILLGGLGCIVSPAAAGTPLLNVPSAGVTGFIAPVTGGTPITASSLRPGSSTQYTVTSLTWSGSPSTYAASTVYTATVTLTSAADYQFSTALTPTVDSGTPAIGAVAGTGTGNTLTFTVTFPATAAAVSTTPLVALFTASTSSGTAPLTVQFTDTSTGSPTTWDWNFGDGGTNSGHTASNESPSYTYTSAGTYPVTLTIGDGGVLASNTSTQTTMITVNAGATTTAGAPTVTSISPTYGPLSTGTTITITGTNFTGATGVTFGGTAANSFSVVSSTEITATSPASVTPGQVDVLVTTPEGISTAVPGDKYNFAATATTIPVPIFSASPTSGTAPLEVTFTDESTGNPASWSWNFGDGNTSTLENPTNTYAVNGTYTVSLTEVNSINSNETTMTGYIVVGATTPVAAFSASPLSGIAPLTVQFIDQSTGSPTQWEWSFGDGSTGSAESPSHVYTNPGTYTATLVSINSEGSSTNGPTQTITVNSGAAAATPVPTFTTAPTFAINTESTTSGVNSWLAQQQAIATAVPTHKSPGYDAFAALIGCGVIAGIALYRKK